MNRDRRDPFENTTSFTEDPYAESSSSGEERNRLGVRDQRRGSVSMIHQFRSATDPVVNEGQSIDSELAGTGSAVQGSSSGPDSSNSYPPHPSFTRTFSAPLPNRIGTLRHPLSPNMSPHSPQNQTTFSVFSPTTARPPTDATKCSSSEASASTSPSEDIATPLQTVSLELADSLQSAIQTLLHLSPPHLLDNAKEQYSGCTVQMPVTSLSALLTSMRSLNYLSANVEALAKEEGGKEEELLSGGQTAAFDVGELLQNVADLLSGQAAQAGVDFVLFHGDVGIKHISVHGDGEGLAYALGHVSSLILAC